jgi:glycosyl transferase family 2/glycosyl transferase family 1
MGVGRVCIVSASRQNVFFSEILEALGGMLARAGVTVEQSVDCFPPPADDLVCLFVPHEFHALVEDLAHPTPDQLQRSVVVCTEQPGTPWFELSAGIAAKAGAVLDINALGVTEMQDRGIAAERLQLGYVPEWDAWDGRADRERPTDLIFLGGYTERRALVLARSADYLQGRRATIKLTETGEPHRGEDDSFWARDRKWDALAGANLLLNVHRSAAPYTEWHRFLGAQANGCVVVTEHCVGSEPLVAGTHYVSADYWQLPSVVGALLADPDRVERIRRAAYDHIREAMPAEQTADRLLAAIEHADENRISRPSETPSSVPLPLPPSDPTPPWEEHVENAGETLAMRVGLKHLITRVHSLERHVARLSGDDDSSDEAVVHFGPQDTEPKVSVILTVHNYADHVGDAVRSVALSSMGEVEVVAVDDASTDNSVAAVELACSELPWLRLKHVRLKRNRGLPVARNLAASHASADLLFVLDADNEVLPTGLERLVAALEARPDAGFAYGIIQVVASSGPADLMSWMPWDAAQLRQGNYIDAMALLRRSSLEAVGGYSTDPALYGWEDYALWLALAEEGVNGVHVPDFVARYRKSPHSMIAVTNVDSTAAWGTLLRRYPGLVQDPSITW